jgi:hypothetical protein
MHRRGTSSLWGRERPAEIIITHLHMTWMTTHLHMTWMTTHLHMTWMTAQNIVWGVVWPEHERLKRGWTWASASKTYLKPCASTFKMVSWEWVTQPWAWTSCVRIHDIYSWVHVHMHKCTRPIPQTPPGELCCMYWKNLDPPQATHQWYGPVPCARRSEKFDQLPCTCTQTYVILMFSWDPECWKVWTAPLYRRTGRHKSS